MSDSLSTRANFLPSPFALFKLRQFGDVIRRLAGETPYLVGSVLSRRDYRDVDVRIILDEDAFERLFGGDVDWRTNPALTLANMALSALAREMTALDVDCQVQRIDNANTEIGQRHALFSPTYARPS